ncbi:hypothetical protein [Pseudomonas sp. PvP001]|uniref:hypothetical protein n=1 Tax=Pseudomonas sp. PvP001 TaxID=3158559 RepID=UPI00339434FD
MPENFEDSAVRHFDDAEILAAAGSIDGAGHLIGFSAECGIKHGIRILMSETDHVHGHFPELVDKAKRALTQRRQTGLYGILKNRNLLENWKVDLRYSSNHAIEKSVYEEWRRQTYTILHAAGLRRRK